MGYYILNGNIHNADHPDMLSTGKASAQYSKWKVKIERLSAGDVIFLYHNDHGIVALGDADGILNTAPINGVSDEEYYMTLRRYTTLINPIPFKKINNIISTNCNVRGTLNALPDDSGKAILKYIYNPSNGVL